MNNIKFSYLYRDAGNYKKWSRIVFSNPDNLSPESVEKAVRRFLSQECMFVASQIRVPECFLFAGGYATSDDHCFHEFDQVETTPNAPNDLCGRSISQFIGEIEREAARGWTAFDPHDRLSRS